jgi:hypothetical protein
LSFSAIPGSGLADYLAVFLREFQGISIKPADMSLLLLLRKQAALIRQATRPIAKKSATISDRAAEAEEQFR